MLEVTQVNTGYGAKQALYGVSLSVQTSEIVALIGPNGAGKSTILKAVHGLLPVWQGSVNFDGQVLDGASPGDRVATGIAFAPQGSRVFTQMTVRENLEIGGIKLAKKDVPHRIEESLEIFPAIQGRLHQKAGSLSGGEQQMVAIARALMPKPKLLMLDEPTLGLSPNLVRELLDKVVAINQETSVAILIVEQKVREVLKMCNRVYALKFGKVAYEGQPRDLSGNHEKLRKLFL